MNRHESTIERDGATVPVKVGYNYQPGCRGARDSLGGRRGAGPALEPDEPASIEIVDTKLIDGSEVELTDAETDRIETEIGEAINAADVLAEDMMWAGQEADR